MTDSNKKEKIRAVVRIRGTDSEKKKGGNNSSFQFSEREKCITELKSGSASSVEPKKHAYDDVFGPEKKTEYVYDMTCKKFVERVTIGENATVMAYGKTGSGKTYTMQGKGKRAGIMQMAADNLYELIAKKEKDEKNPREFTVSVSYMEIYNDKKKDLLSGEESEDKSNKLSSMTVTSAEGLRKVIMTGSKNRTVANNNRNEVSSRSHAIMQMRVESRPRGSCSDESDTNKDNRTLSSHGRHIPGRRASTSSIPTAGVQSGHGHRVNVDENGKNEDEGILTATLTFVDLAGSESAGHTSSIDKERQKESGKINSSLFDLSQLINYLAKGEMRMRPSSTLGKSLHSYLGGNSHVSIVGCVTLDEESRHVTKGTLKFMDDVSQVVQAPQVNRKANLDAQLRVERRKNKDLMAQVEELIRSRKQLENDLSASKALGEAAEVRVNEAMELSEASEQARIEAVNSNNTLVSKIGSLEDELKISSSTILELQQNVEKYSVAVESEKSLREEVELTLQSELEDVQEQLEAIQGDLNDKSSQLENKSHVVEEMVDANKSLTNRIASLEKELVDIENKKEILTAHHEQQHAEWEEKCLELESQMDELQSLLNQNTSASEAAAITAAGKVTEMTDALKSVQVKLDTSEKNQHDLRILSKSHEETIEKLNEKIVSLESDAVKSEGDIMELMSQMEELEQELQERSEELSDTKVMLDSKTQALSDSEQSVLMQNEEISAINQKVQLEISGHEATKAALEDVKQQLESTEYDLEEAMENLASINKDLTLAKEHNDTLQTSLDEATSNLLQREQNCDKLNDELMSLKDSLNDALTTANELEETVTTKDGEIEKLSQELEETVTTKDGEIEKLSQELEETVTTKDGEIEKLSQELEETVTTKDGEIEKLSQELEETVTTKDSEIEKLSQELEETVTTKDGEIEKLSQELEETVTTKDSEIEKLSQELEETVTTKDGEIEKLSQELEETVTTKDGEIEKLSQELEETVTTKDSEIEKLSQELEETVTTKDGEIEKLSQELEETVTTKDSEIEKLSQELEETVTTKDSEIEKLSQELEETVTTKDGEIEKLSQELEETVTTKDGEIEKLSQELEETVTTKDGEIEKLSQELEETVTTKDGEIEKLSQELEETVTTKDGEIEKLSQELEETVTTKDGEIEKLSQELEEVMLSLGTVHEENDKLKNKLSEVSDNANSFELQLRSLDEDTSSALRTAAESEATLKLELKETQANLKDTENRLKDVQDRLAVSLEDYKVAQVEAEKEINHLNSELEEANDSLNVSKQRVVELEETAEQNTALMNDLKNNADVATSSLEEVKEEMNGILEQLEESQSERNELEVALNDTEKDLEASKDEITRTSCIVQQLESNVSNLQVELSQNRTKLENLGSSLQEAREKSEEDEELHRSLKQQLEETEERIESIDNDLYAARTEITKRDEQLLELKGSNDSNQSRVEELEEDLKQKNDELHMLQQNLKENNGDLVEIHEKYTESNAELQRMEMMNTSLKSQIENFTQEIERRGMLVEELEVYKLNLEEIKMREHQDLCVVDGMPPMSPNDHEISDLDGLLATNMEDLNSSRKQNEYLQVALKSLEDQLSTGQVEQEHIVDQLKKDLASAQSERNQYLGVESERNALHIQLESSMTRVSELESELEDKQVTIETLDDSVEEYNAKLLLSQGEVKALSDEIKDLKEEISTVKSESDSRLTEETQEAERREVILNEKIETHEKENQMLSELVQSLQNQIEKSGVSFNELQQEVKQKEEEGEQLKQNIEAARIEYDSLTCDAKTLKTKLQTTEQKLNDTEMEVDLLKEKLGATSDELERVGKEKSRIEEGLNVLSSDSEAAFAYRNAAEKALEDLNSEVKSAREEIERLETEKKEVDEVKSCLEAEIDAIKRDLESTQKCVEAVEKERDELKKVGEKVWLEQLNALQSEVHDHKARSADLMEKMQIQDKEVAIEAKKTAEVLERNANDIKNLKEKITVLEKELDGALSSLASEKERAQSLIQSSATGSAEAAEAAKEQQILVKKLQEKLVEKCTTLKELESDKKKSLRLLQKMDVLPRDVDKVSAGVNKLFLMIAKLQEKSKDLQQQILRQGSSGVSGIGSTEGASSMAQTIITLNSKNEELKLQLKEAQEKLRAALSKLKSPQHQGRSDDVDDIAGIQSSSKENKQESVSSSNLVENTKKYIAANEGRATRSSSRLSALNSSNVSANTKANSESQHNIDLEDCSNEVILTKVDSTTDMKKKDQKGLISKVEDHAGDAENNFNAVNTDNCPSTEIANDACSNVVEQDTMVDATTSSTITTSGRITRSRAKSSSVLNDVTNKPAMSSSANGSLDLKRSRASRSDAQPAVKRRRRLIR